MEWMEVVELKSSREELAELYVRSDHVIALGVVVQSHSEGSERELWSCRDNRQERGTD